VVSDVHSKNVGVKSLVNVFRRLHRIFAHAWFQHRSVFWAVEGQTGLYVFFKTVCDLYDLLPAENYKLPPEAEGLEAHPEFDVMANRAPPPQILKPSSSQTGENELDDDGPHGSGNRTNTRRHIRSNPSTGSSITTVLETEEENADGVSRRLRNMHLAGPDLLEEEPEVAEVPVIVEQSVIAGPPPPLLFSLSSGPSQDEAGTTVFDLSVAGQTGVSESIVEITEDDVTSVIDTSDLHTVQEAEEAEEAEETAAEVPDDGHVADETPNTAEESATSEPATETAEEEPSPHQETTQEETTQEETTKEETPKEETPKEETTKEETTKEETTKEESAPEPEPAADADAAEGEGA
jgi:hypothetical protein